MTDEQLGRAYCAAKGIAPVVRTFPCEVVFPNGQWVEVGKPEPPQYGLAVPIPGPFEKLDYEGYATEADVFAALGADLRQWLAFADGVREVLK